MPKKKSKKTVAEALHVNINPIPVSIVEEGGSAPQPLVGYAAAQPKSCDANRAWRADGYSTRAGRFFYVYVT
ncbi:hypothetical protein GCM10020331_042420 [Ectobacillus funiculus]